MKQVIRAIVHRTQRSMLLKVPAMWVMGAIMLQAPVSAQSASGHPDWPGPGQLYVGTCYQPIERTPQEIDRDIALMKQSGFNVVRIGDLSWGSFEPSQGEFAFAWLDTILVKMRAAGIRVILDIPGTPAPIWLHRAYPGVDIVAQDGKRMPPAERYMDDISDPNYVREVGILAETMMKHYAHNPAIIAIGYDNEIGNGYMSYSEGDRERFIGWLEQKYGSVGELNKAWQTEWWSRGLNQFDQVYMPLADGPGASDNYLDLHRFWSDVAIARLEQLEALRKRYMPDVPTISNLWPTAERRGFNYLGSYKSYVSYGAEGFYPSDPVSGAFLALTTKGSLPTPIWFNEFTAGGGGFYGARGESRMYANLGLLMGAQGFLAWTFNSHLGGEEQALFGLLDHDSTPSWKLGEWAVLASEFKDLAKDGFPRYTHPQVAIAYSFDSAVDSHPNGPSSTTRQYFKPSYTEQVQGAFEPLFRDNIDTAIINIGHDSLAPYKLVVVPADYVMDAASADAIRQYVRDGGTVVMTMFSAKVDQHGNWFNTPLPGLLSDVFGLRTSAFYRVKQSLQYSLDGRTVDTGTREYEVPEPTTAQVLARFTDIPDHTPAVTVNKFGKGEAVYLATWSNAAAIGPLLSSLFEAAGVQRGPQTPEGVYARAVGDRIFYVNTTEQEQSIPITGTKKGIISHHEYERAITLGPWQSDLVQ